MPHSRDQSIKPLSPASAATCAPFEFKLLAPGAANPKLIASLHRMPPPPYTHSLPGGKGRCVGWTFPAACPSSSSYYHLHLRAFSSSLLQSSRAGKACPTAAAGGLFLVRGFVTGIHSCLLPAIWRYLLSLCRCLSP